jgi:anhydro-N-acetylmuramic acid kinase
MTTRSILGLSVGSGQEAVEAALVRIEGVGLTLSCHVLSVARAALPKELRTTARKSISASESLPPQHQQELADILGHAARQAAGGATRSIWAMGLLGHMIETVAEPLAEQLGLTVITGFSDRDRAAQGHGRPITSAADYLLFRDESEDRLVIHLGGYFRVIFIPARSRITEMWDFETGPGNRLLNEIACLGSRGRDRYDPGGTYAVQGRCLEDLLHYWLSHSYLARRPPKIVPNDVFDDTFVMDAFDKTRAAQGTYHDLLCTVSRYAIRCVGLAVRTWLPTPDRIYVCGGGVRNGYLWKLLGDEFPTTRVQKTDVLGIPASSRSAVGAATLTALTLDGVNGNLPLLTKAHGGRLLGRIIPGDQHNWARCLDWMARLSRAPVSQAA